MSASPAFLALIVGGSSGMGKQTAKRLLRRGGEVWLVARHAARLAQAKAELAADGPVQTAAVDLYDESQVDAFIDRLKQEPNRPAWALIRVRDYPLYEVAVKRP